jgi:aminopeptidase I
MVRHTPEFLRARSSNLSLRSVAMEQSMTMRAEQVDNTMDAKDLRPEAFTKPYVEFMTENPTVFHAVDYFKQKLLKAGYKEVGRPDPTCGDPTCTCAGACKQLP